MRRQVLLYLLVFGISAGWTQEVGHQLRWTGVEYVAAGGDMALPVLTLDGAVLNPATSNLPWYRYLIEQRAGQVAHIEIRNPSWQALDELERKALEGLEHLIGPAEVVQRGEALDRKMAYDDLRILPFRQNALSGKFEKVMSFELETTWVAAPRKIPGKKGLAYADHSVLASGKWYKIATTANGVYRLTYDDLVKLGMKFSGVNPENIQLYGNGAGMLSEVNSADRYDDLTENAILVVGGGDGSFDPGDYVLFYGQHPIVWDYTPEDSSYHHEVNLYANKVCYFITVGGEPGKRIQQVDHLGLLADRQVNSFNDFVLHESDKINLLKSGKAWYGETFDILTTYDFSFSMSNLAASGAVSLMADVVARSSQNSVFSLDANGNKMDITITKINPSQYNSDYARSVRKVLTFTSASSTINVKLKYNKPESSAIGWLNYLELNARRKLVMTNAQMVFRDARSVGEGRVAEFVLSGISGSPLLWDVTDLQNVTAVRYNLNGSELRFKAPSDQIREYVACTGQSFLVPQLLGSLANQDLHGLGQYDYVIVTHPDFTSAAKKLIEVHRAIDDLSIVAVTTEQVYNEFSSGVQDVSAIRNFMKMFYDRAETEEDMPKYLLLLGDGSYDYKDIKDGNTNYVPTFQAANSLQPISSYLTDDFFGLLDDGEGKNAEGTLDIGIGRFPVATLQQANDAVDKVRRYTSRENSTDSSRVSYANVVPNFGDWRNMICFIGDDEDGNMHLSQANQLATYVDTTYRQYNVDKIFFDAYKQQSTSAGQRYPDVNQAINNRIEKGALIINYTGHGGELGWAHERVLGASDINSWSNYNNLTVFVTATCEFSRFDDYERVSAGELAFLNPHGGAIAMFTTTRLAFSSSNYLLNRSFYYNVFNKVNGEFPKMGDLVRLAKVANGSNLNIRNFVLLGDPALRIAYPECNVVTTSVNGSPVSQYADTLKALSEVTVTGYIADVNGDTVTGFNGLIYPTILDKPSVVTTLSNDNGSPSTSFNIQKNILFKGKVSVSQGLFSFSFVVPKDISYNYGIGKISYYAASDLSDASGYYKGIVIGGTNSNAEDDNIGPALRIFMSDTTFEFGGITDENPLFLAFVEDKDGINTTGNGIGHDIVAVLDDDYEGAIILNDYYESDLNNYRKGSIIYPFYNLEEGLHTLTLKVWDVFNNSSVAYLEFNVSKSDEFTIGNVINFPNPFFDETAFYFEHNSPYSELSVSIQIYSLRGELVKILQSASTNEGYNVNPIKWNGYDDYGRAMGNGIYIYKLQVVSAGGDVLEKNGKLLIMR